MPRAASVHRAARPMINTPRDRVDASSTPRRRLRASRRRGVASRRARERPRERPRDAASPSRRRSSRASIGARASGRRMREGVEATRARARSISVGRDDAVDASNAGVDAIEALEIELGEVRRALERLEASCEALEEATRGAAADKEYADALRENARTISTLQARVYGLTLEIERRRGNVGVWGAADADEGAWV